MTRPYSLAFKQKMVERLIGKHAQSALQLAKETGVRQQNLSRWLEEARSLPLVAADKRTGLDPLWWTLHRLVRRSLQWRASKIDMRRSFGARWSSWFELDVARPSWRGSLVPRPGPSHCGSSRRPAMPAKARSLVFDLISGPIAVNARKDGRTVLSIALDPAPLFRGTGSDADNVVAGA